VKAADPMRTLLGLAVLVAFAAYCFTRRRARRELAGDGARRLPRSPASPGRLVHAGDPTVRH